MQNLYPLFERNRILRKELLSALRDYSFAYASLEYMEYGDGILRGCDIRIKEKKITVTPGIIKWGGHIFLMTQEECVDYAPSDRTVTIKLRLQKERTADFVSCRMELVSDYDALHSDHNALYSEHDGESQGYGVESQKCGVERQAHGIERRGCGESQYLSAERQKDGTGISKHDMEFELCRYRLQEGARLRTDYKDFEDMGTQYDTVNYIHAAWGCLRGNSLSPVITRRFAQEVLKVEKRDPEDTTFAYLCLSQPGALPREILIDFVGQRNGCGVLRDAPNEVVFEEMCRALGKIRSGMGGERRERTGKRQIIVE